MNSINKFFFLGLITLSYSILIGQYPYIKKLNNNKYILISSKGITFLDNTLISSSNDMTFADELYSGFEDAYSTTAVQFSEEEGNLIFVILKDIFYVFSPDETLLTQTNFNDDGYYTMPFYIYPYKKIDNTYILLCVDVDDFTQGFIYLNFHKISYDSNTKTITYSDRIRYTMLEFDSSLNLQKYESASCALLKNGDSQYINCFYSVYGMYKLANFDPENNFEANVILSNNEQKENDCISFKSLTLPGNDKVIHCLLYLKMIECYEYNITSNTFKLFKSFTHDIITATFYDCNIEFFEESERIVISLLGITDETHENQIIIFICDLKGECTQKDYSTIDGISVDDIFTKINLVIPFDNINYHIIAYKDDTSNYCLDLDIKFDLICHNYYNYAQTSCLDTIPDGYFCNNTNAKTIDKCHADCKTCKNVPTENNSNCLTCQNNLLYLDIGNCVDSCENGYFTDESNNLICKCSNNIKCLLCSEDNLCITCNNDEGYYPKSNENQNGDFINCYKEPEGYYLSNNLYHPCYKTCKSCNGEGDVLDNKCIQCLD